MSRETFVIEEVETRPGKRGPFKRAKLSGIGYVSVFADGDKDFLEENVGQPATAEIEIANAEKGWKNAKDFDKPGPGAVTKMGSESMSKGEWDEKEDRQRVGILYSVHLKQMFEWRQANPDIAVIQSYGDLVAQARRQAVKDLDWIRNYATGAVPFSEGEDGAS